MTKRDKIQLIKVTVTPGASKQEIRKLADESFLVKVTSPPFKNRANRELCEILAVRFRVPKSAVRIKQGRRSRRKLIEIILR